MPDNLNITSGSGIIISTDQDPSSSAHYQRIKLVDGNLNSSNATGVPVNPLTVNVSNTSATISVLNTIATVSVLNTGAAINILNTISTVSVLNTSATISVLNTGAAINVLNTRVTVAVSNTGGAVTVSNTGAYNVVVLNTSSGTNVNVLNTVQTVAVSNTGAAINVLNTRVSVAVSGGVTLLSAVPISLSNTGAYNVIVLNTSSGTAVNVLNSANWVMAVSNTGGAVTVSNTGAYNVVVLNTSSGTNVNVLNTVQTVAVSNTGASINVLNTRTTIGISGGATLLSSIPLTILNTRATVAVSNTGGSVSVLNTRTSITVSGGVTLLSAIAIAVKKDVVNYSPTWIYSALSSAVETSVWTPAAGKKFNITDLTLNLKSGAPGTVTFRQGVTGSIIMIVDLLGGGGWVTNLQTPYASTSADSPLTVKCDATGTSGYVGISGYEA